MTLGERIKEKRKARGLTQKQLADHFGISSVSVSEWERDLSRPDADKFASLATVLRTTVDYLLTGRGDRGSTEEKTLAVGPDIKGESAIDFLGAGRSMDRSCKEL